jgi:Cu-Zn family superoxide dismutase
MVMRHFRIHGLTCIVAAALAGCATPDSAGPIGGASATPTAPATASASATLAPTQGNTAAGTMTFESRGGEVRVQVRMTGLKPNVEHEKGDCSAPDATSAGGHFNPHGTPHGPQDAPHHAGDMPALKADAQGVAEIKFTMKGVTIGGDAADIVGKGVIVHAQPDDYKTQPTGNSGARIACGVVTRI